jgi:hypothetical protein
MQARTDHSRRAVFGDRLRLLTRFEAIFLAGLRKGGMPEE